MALSFLNSRIFPSSWSTTDLNASSQNLNYNYGYAATDLTLQRRNPTQVSLLDRPDESITALPSHDFTTDVQDTQGKRETTSQSTQEDKKKSKWIRIKAKAKAKWQQISKMRRREMVIGKPTDFKRVGGVELLMRPQPRYEAPCQDDEWDAVPE
jgi:hypothetical protein